MSGRFEGSSAGRLPDDAVLECGVCWWVFDPDQGDEQGDILPGTPFTALPAGWRCPSCDADKSKFMLPEGGQALPEGDNAASAQPHDLANRVATLLADYRTAEDSIIGLPVHNRRLRVEAVGFRHHTLGDGSTAYVGVIVTPWCMNLIVLPADPATPPPGALGSSRDIVFPSGAYPFLAARMDSVGAVESCSLFSPMEMFDSPDVARVTAQAAADGLFAPDAKAGAPAEAPDPTPVASTPMSRRSLFGRSGTGAAREAAE